MCVGGLALFNVIQEVDEASKSSGVDEISLGEDNPWKKVLLSKVKIPLTLSDTRQLLI